MPSLLIDTSTEQGIVALANDGDVIWEEKLPIGLHNSRYVMPSIKRSFVECSLNIDDLDYIAVGVGPGSYTGIRISAAVAETIAYVRRIPLVGITTLAGFTPEQEGPFASLLDAKIGGVYLMIGERDHKTISFNMEPIVSPIEEIACKLDGVTMLVTPHQKALQPKIENQYPQIHWEWLEASISSQLLVRHAHKKYQSGKYSIDAQLDLLYLRKTQAEIEKDAKREFSS